MTMITKKELTEYLRSKNKELEDKLEAVKKHYEKIPVISRARAFDMPSSWCPTFMTVYGFSTLAVRVLDDQRLKGARKRDQLENTTS